MIMDQPTMRASLDEPSGEIVTVSFVPSPSSEKRSVDRPIFPVGGSQVQDERVALRGYRGEGDAVACRQLGRIRPFRRVLAIITFPSQDRRVGAVFPFPEKDLTASHASPTISTFQESTATRFPISNERSI
jgi:hypothetical protein